VCTDCDEKWHQHPKRRNHKRELLRPTFVNGMSSSMPSPGNFTRTASATETMESSSVPINTSVGKSPEQRENISTVAGDVDVPTSLAANKPLATGTTVKQSDVNFLPRSVMEINDDLSFQSLVGVKSSLASERNSSGQNAHRCTPDTGHRSKSRQFSSVTSDFQSTLKNLQSVMNEVNSTMNDLGQNSSSGFDDWSLSPAVNKQSVVSKALVQSGVSSNYSHSASTAAKKPELKQSVVQNTDRKQVAVDEDAELARLLTQTKYPPKMGASGSPVLPHMKPVVNEQAIAYGKPQNTDRSFDAKHSVVPDVTSNTKNRRDAVQRLPASYDLPRTGLQSTLPVENESSVHGNAWTRPGTSNNSAQSQFMVNRQKSQTYVMQRLTDSPGVVFPRVGDGKDLGVWERTGDDSELYRSKFTDIHDEVYSNARFVSYYNRE